MTAIARRPRVSVAYYLAGEESAECRHEFLDGDVHGMSGASARHNTICLNLATALHRHLAGGPCRVFMADLKVHLHSAGEEYFYYPDVMVACRPDDTASHYRNHPCVLVEVMSPTTERTDRREKLFAYQQIAALEEYVLIGQDSIEVAIYRRADDWAATRPNADGSVQLQSIGFELPVSALYAGLDSAA